MWKRSRFFLEKWPLGSSPSCSESKNTFSINSRDRGIWGPLGIRSLSTMATFGTSTNRPSRSKRLHLLMVVFWLRAHSSETFAKTFAPASVARFDTACKQER
jgi:hypothetical protein